MGNSNKVDSKDIEKILSSVIEHAKKGEIIFTTIEGPMVANIEDFIKQGAEGVLYDLKKDLAVLYTFFKATGELRYINDIAIANVLKYTINKLKELETKYQEISEK